MWLWHGWSYIHAFTVDYFEDVHSVTGVENVATFPTHPSNIALGHMNTSLLISFKNKYLP